MPPKSLWPKLTLALTLSLTLAAARAATPWTQSSLTTPTPATTSTPTLQIGQPVPPLLASDLADNQVSLDTLKGHPIVLQFGSITEPVFRMHVDATEKLAASLAGKVTFVVLYQKEAHPADGPDPLDVNSATGFGIAAPTSEEERRKLADQTADRLTIKHQKIWVDAWNNTSAQRFAALPNLTLILDSHGNLAAAYPWMDPLKVRGALADLLANKPIAPNHMGPMRTAAAPTGSIDMTDQLTGRGRPLMPLIIALDSLTLTEKQRTAIYPPLLDYINQLKDLRGAKPPTKTVASATTTTTTATAPAKPADPVIDRDALILQLRASAAKLQEALKTNLSPADYTKVITPLTTGPGKVFFTPFTASQESQSPTHQPVAATHPSPA